MEKVKVERKSNIDSFKNKDKVAEKIDSLWGEKKSIIEIINLNPEK